MADPSCQVRRRILKIERSSLELMSCETLGFTMKFSVAEAIPGSSRKHTAVRKPQVYKVFVRIVPIP